MSRMLVVKNWDSFQHYKDRNPPWIKLYRETFTTESWVLGTDLSRLLQLASTMLAARYNNQIPLSYKLLTKVASLDCDEQSFMAAVAHLVDHNFLEIQGEEETGKHIASVALATCTVEVEERQRRDRGEERREEPSVADATSGAVERVFSHWQSSWSKTRAKLDAKRRKLIRGALSNYSEADLCQAISGYRNSPHHMGRNDRSTVYDDIELFLRDAKHIDAGLNFYATPPRTDLSAKTQRIIDQTEGWTPPEMRHAAN